MTVDELINKAKDGGGGYLNPTNLFALAAVNSSNTNKNLIPYILKFLGE